MPTRPWSPASRGAGCHVLPSEVLEDPKAGLSEVLRATPGWQEGAAEAASVEQVSGAMTNLVFKCTTPGPATANMSVIVRVFGAGGKLFSQQDERNIFLLASQLGLGPRCLVEFENGRVEEFLPGDTLSCDTMRQPDVSAAIAAAMAAFHVRMLARLPAAHHAAAGAGNNRQSSSGEAAAPAAAEAGGGNGLQPALRPAIYGRIRQWHAAALDVCGTAELAQAGLSNLLEELAELESRLRSLFPSWVGFCHNDLQYGNMLLSRASTGSSSTTSGGSSGSEGGSSGTGTRGAAGAAAAGAAAAGAPAPAPTTPAVATASAAASSAATPAATPAAAAGLPAAVGVSLIDYEYSTLNDVAFDVANHFCEWAYNYHSDAAHEFHSAWLPSEDQQLHFCRAYVSAMRAQQAQHAQQAEAAAGPVRPGVGAELPPSQQDGTAAEGSYLPALILSSGSSHAAADGCGGNSGSSSKSNGGGGSSEGEAGGEEAAAAAAERVARLLVRKAQAHSVLVHLKWGLWGLIQDRLSDCDFDYLSYAKQRLELYHSTKKALLTRREC